MSPFTVQRNTSQINKETASTTCSHVALNARDTAEVHEIITSVEKRLILATTDTFTENLFFNTKRGLTHECYTHEWEKPTNMLLMFS